LIWNLIDYDKCALCFNYCRVTATCKPSKIVTLDRCFWEEKITGISVFKNNEIIEFYSVTLTVGPHQIAPYGFWRHTNNQTGKESK
jgi:hypothetical protein